MMRKIGFRVNLDGLELASFAKEYASYFDTIEVKVTDHMIHTYGMNHMVHYLETRGISNISFHLPKNTLYEEHDYQVAMLALDGITNKRLVTHFCKRTFLLGKDNPILLQKLQENKAILCVENTEVMGSLIEYLEELKLFVSQNHFKVCLDLGHLFYSAFISHVDSLEIVKYLITDTWWGDNVEEVHLHDFNEKQCHLNLGEGRIDFDLAHQIFSCLKKDCPVIIETTIVDPHTQGLSEIKLTRERVCFCDENC